jgi:uncharacterized damage-inducible protein DinB
VHPLEEAFAHSHWATDRLIGHLGKLDPAALEAEAPGTYGQVLATLSHLLGADGRYLTYLEGDSPPARTGPDATRPLEELADQLRDQAVRWRLVLARLGELDITLPARGERPELPHATNLLLVQALHHANDHRTQICTDLSANGFQAPDLDVWRYWMERRAVGAS